MGMPATPNPCKKLDKELHTHTNYKILISHEGVSSKTNMRYPNWHPESSCDHKYILISFLQLQLYKSSLHFCKNDYIQVTFMNTKIIK